MGRVASSNPCSIIPQLCASRRTLHQSSLNRADLGAERRIPSDFGWHHQHATFLLCVAISNPSQHTHTFSCHQPLESKIVLRTKIQVLVSTPLTKIQVLVSMPLIKGKDAPTYNCNATTYAFQSPTWGRVTTYVHPCQKKRMQYHIARA